MWLGEQITARGIGNGISLIIFVGIIAELPAAFGQFFTQGRSGAIGTGTMLGVIAMLIITLGFVVFMERSLRKIHIQYPRRQVGMKTYDGGSSHLPIKVNPAGVIPAIFASALLLLPTTLGNLLWWAIWSRYVNGPRIFWPRSARLSGFLYCDDRILHVFLYP